MASRPESGTNHALSATYEPGSTLKPLTVALALRNELLTPDTIFDCENGIWDYEGQPLRDLEPYGKLSVAEIVKKSSAIGTAKIAQMLGNERLYSGLRSFGFGLQSGIALPHENSGILPPVNTWSSQSCRIAIGQGIAVTAMQVAGMMSAIANDGVLLKPYLATNGSAVQTNSIPIDPSIAAMMRAMLARVTEEGGAGTGAQVKGFKVAGVTGTAPKVVNGSYSETAYIASFAGFIPADKPEVTIVVVVDEPKPHHTGGVVAAPVFARIAEQTMRYMNIKPGK
jgi:cell division protein FtsI (penicillin-binding protein 3)